MVKTKEQGRRDAKRYREKHPDRIKKSREKCKPWMKEYIKEYRKDPKNIKHEREYHIEYREQNRKNINKWSRLRKYKIKQQLLKEMGQKCVCCGITEWWLLTLDYIKPIKGIRNRSESLVAKLLKNKELQREFQIMCFGCNNSKNTGEKCLIH